MAEEDALVRNRFPTSTVIADIPDELQDQFCDLRNDSLACDIFHEMTLSRFWCAVRESYNCLYRLFEYCFCYRNISLQDWFLSCRSNQNEGTKWKESWGSQKTSTVKHSTTNFEVYHGCKVNRQTEYVCEIQWPFEFKYYEMHFCGNNIVVVCCIFVEMHFCGNHNG